MEFYKKPPLFLLVFSFFFFLPLAIMAFHMAFTKIVDPFIFVILIFSASLSLLISLVALFALFVNYISPKIK